MSKILKIDSEIEISIIELVVVQNFVENKAFLLFGTKFGPNRYLLFGILKTDSKFDISTIELISVQKFVENKVF